VVLVLAGPVPDMVTRSIVEGGAVIGLMVKVAPAGIASGCAPETGAELTLRTFPGALARAVTAVPAGIPPPATAEKLATQVPCAVTVAVIGVVLPLWVTSVPFLAPAVPPV
jgi:hypothetical protein